MYLAFKSSLCKINVIERSKQMFGREKNGIMVVLTAAACFLCACAGGTVKVEPIPTSQKPVEQVSLLEKEINNARNNQLNILAPTWFSKAENSLNRARKGLENEDKLSEVLKNVTYGRAHLQRAKEVENQVRTALTDVIKARELARAAGATKFGEDYAKVEEQFFRLVKAIEKNNQRWARNNKAKVISTFNELELLAIKGILDDVRKLIKEAEKSGAKKFTPQTFKVAQDKLRDVDVFISQHRYEKEEIHKQVNEAFFEARRLLQMIRHSNKINKMQPEQIALWIEGMLYSTSTKLSAPDVRDQDFETQAENILSSVTALLEDHKFIVQKVKTQQADLEHLRTQVASTERLTEEKRFQQLFSEVQSYFDPKDAEVYKRGNQLVIRLKAIHFPVGKDYIMPSNYTLLNKVQRAIRSFGESNVVIEGHTDSTGSDALNKHLSQRRAEAVREYFVANGTLVYDSIAAIGYGSNRPLATNKTSKGRAINRRIDIVITPNTQTAR
jgi:outer membrane protein OmpA-like peptidoglycan-associated protein